MSIIRHNVRSFTKLPLDGCVAAAVQPRIEHALVHPEPRRHANQCPREQTSRYKNRQQEGCP
jgi:hypothetical protein